MKENQRISLTKRILKETLLRLLKVKELNAISITELCRESEINRATFYRHYTLPKDVLLDIEKDFIKELSEAAKHIKTETDAENYLEHLCLLFYEHSALITYFMENNLDYEIESLLSEFYKSLLKFRKTDANLNDIDSYIINTYLSGGAYLILRKWTNGEIKKTPEEISHIVLNLLKGDFRI